MCLATSANDETWTSNKHISVLEAPLFGAGVVVAASAAVVVVSITASLTALLGTAGASIFETSAFELACCAGTYKRKDHRIKSREYNIPK